MEREVVVEMVDESESCSAFFSAEKMATELADWLATIQAA
jgi:hypothetical protein